MKNSILLFLLFVCFACQDVKKPEVPVDLIDEETMVAIYVETYINNAANSINAKKIREHHIHLDSLLYKKYKIDSLQFAKSNDYYTTDLNSYNSIFKKVETILEEKKNQADSIFQKEKEALKAGKKPVKPNVVKDTVSGLVEPINDSIN